MAWPTADHKVWMLCARGEQIAHQVSRVHCDCSETSRKNPEWVHLNLRSENYGQHMTAACF